MALDTGSTFVTIPTDVARDIGYEVDHSITTIPIVTASGNIRVPLIELASVEVLGARAFGVRALCLDLPRGARFRGLLGLSFLRNFDIDLHLKSGVIEFR